MEIADYLGFVLLLTMTTVTVFVIMFLSNKFGPQNPTRQKIMPYESGSNQLSKPQENRFSVKFYMIAISFILFDLETIFIVPWALSWNQSDALGHGFYSFMVMLIFVAVLTIGLVYEWKQGGLEWD